MTGPGWHSDELEQVSCDLCGHDNRQVLFVRPDGMQVVECVDCCLAYLNPRPKAQFVERLYGREYFSKATANFTVGYADYFTEPYQRGLAAEAESRLRFLEPFVQLRGARTLEVGCATGEFSALLQRRGSRAIGLDLAEAA